MRDLKVIMSDMEHRQIARDSLFVLVDLRIDGEDLERKVKMRNLSAGGMMAEGSARVSRGQAVWVNLRRAGWTEGTVAWVQGDRFGIAFRNEIDPAAARAPEKVSPKTDDFFARRLLTPMLVRDEGPLRKI